MEGCDKKRRSVKIQIEAYIHRRSGERGATDLKVMALHTVYANDVHNPVPAVLWAHVN
jgi:hypothetical protein